MEQEAVAALRALLRCLAGSNLDIHALAERIERGKPLDASEMQRIYDAAYQKGHADGSEQGRRSAILSGSQPVGTFAAGVDDGVNGYTWSQIANYCALNKQRFHGRDLEFVESIVEQLGWRDPSPAQAKWLRDLFMRKFAGRIE